MRRSIALGLIIMGLVAPEGRGEERLTLKVLVVGEAGRVVSYDRIESATGEPVELRARPGSPASALYRYTLRRVDTAFCSTRL